MVKHFQKRVGFSRLQVNWAGKGTSGEQGCPLEVRKKCQHTGQQPANTFVTLEAKLSAVEHITELSEL